MSVNKVILLGYIGNDPEIRYPEKDKPIAFASLATNESSAQGMEKTVWHNLVFYGQLASVVERYVKKGSQIYVEGKITTREYDDRFNIHRTRTEIIVNFLEILGRRS